MKKSQIKKKKRHDRGIGDLEECCCNQKNPDCGRTEKIPKHAPHGPRVPDRVELLGGICHNGFFLFELVEDQLLLPDQEQGQNTEKAAGPDRKESPGKPLVMDQIGCSDGARQESGVIPHLVFPHYLGEPVTPGQRESERGGQCHEKRAGSSSEEQQCP